MAEVVVGLDLSLRNTAMCAIGEDWEQRPERVLFSCVQPQFVAVMRYVEIAERVCEFLRQVSATHVYVEDYPRTMRGSSSINLLIELAGVVKSRVEERCLMRVQPVNIASARKLFFGAGNTPRRGAKKIVFESVKELVPVRNDDEADAFLVAQYGLMDRGHCFWGSE